MSLSMRKRTPLQIQRAVLFALLMRELKTRFGGKLVGLFWVLFEPVMNIYILLFVRSVLRTRAIGPTIEYPVYHVVAMIPYFVFRSCWFRALPPLLARTPFANSSRTPLQLPTSPLPGPSIRLRSPRGATWPTGPAPTRSASPDRRRRP